LASRRREELIERLSLFHGDLDIISSMRGLPINNARASHFFTYDILSLRICNNLSPLRDADLRF
jgi:hypothetical protein